MCSVRCTAHNTTVRVIHNSVRCFFPRSSDQRLTEFTIFYVTGPLLFCDSSTFLPYFAHDSPFDLTPDVTFFNLPFSSSLSKAHLSDPRLSTPFLPSFLPSYLLSHFFQLVSCSSCTTLSHANAAIASRRFRRGHRTAVSHCAGGHSMPSA